MLRKLPGFLKSSRAATVASEATATEPATDTVEHRLAAVGSVVQQSAPDDTGEEYSEYSEQPPLIFGSLRSPREHALKLRECMEAVGWIGKAVHQGELEDLHEEMCERLGWVQRLWPAVGRELARLPGVKKGTVRVRWQRLTVYEIEPAAEAANVIPIERKRDAS
jgi:hypothetical protein